MNQAAVWLDASLDPGHCAAWSALGRPHATNRILAAGRQAGPTIAGWAANRGFETLLILSRNEDRRSARYLANVVSGAQPRLRVTCRTSGIGAMPSLIRFADILTLGVGPVATLAAFDAGLHEVTSGVWLHSVARIKEPAPRFGQYLRSLVPLGPGYLAMFAPTPAVLRARELPPAASVVNLLIAAPENSGVPALLSKAFPGVATYCVPEVVPATKAYGSSGFEFLAERPWSAAPVPSNARCRVCGEALYTPTCPYCHVVARRRGTE